MRPQLSSPGTLERGAGTVYRGTDPPNFKPAPETAAFEPRVSPPKKPETYPMARTTHDPVLTADARSARIADAPIEGAATQTGAGLLDRSCAAHIAPQLRALVVPLDSVTLHPRNPRQGDVAAVAASLRRFGQLKTVVVQASTRYVVAGNHLVRAARSLGWTEIAANVEELDDAEATAFMLADNRTSDLGGYDDALLAASSLSRRQLTTSPRPGTTTMMWRRCSGRLASKRPTVTPTLRPTDRPTPTSMSGRASSGPSDATGSWWTIRPTRLPSSG